VHFGGLGGDGRTTMRDRESDTVTQRVAVTATSPWQRAMEIQSLFFTPYLKVLEPSLFLFLFVAPCETLKYSRG
jgi:hypothetical protein